MSGAAILDRLWDVIRARRDERPDGSYVVSLLEGGQPAVAAKVREEAQELIDAGAAGQAPAIAHEAADLLFHVWVLLGASGVSPQAVYAELERRFGLGGLEEKARRAGRAARPGPGREEGGAC